MSKDTLTVPIITGDNKQYRLDAIENIIAPYFKKSKNLTFDAAKNAAAARGILTALSVHSVQRSAIHGVFLTARKNDLLCHPSRTQSGFGFP